VAEIVGEGVAVLVGAGVPETAGDGDDVALGRTRPTATSARSTSFSRE
jgi:hypothetical protein